MLMEVMRERLLRLRDFDISRFLFQEKMSSFLSAVKFKIVLKLLFRFPRVSLCNACVCLFDVLACL